MNPMDKDSILLIGGMILAMAAFVIAYRTSKDYKFQDTKYANNSRIFTILLALLIALLCTFGVCYLVFRPSAAEVQNLAKTAQTAFSCAEISATNGRIDGFSGPELFDTVMQEKDGFKVSFRKIGLSAPSSANPICFCQFAKDLPDKEDARCNMVLYNGAIGIHLAFSHANQSQEAAYGKINLCCAVNSP